LVIRLESPQGPQKGFEPPLRRRHSVHTEWLDRETRNVSARELYDHSVGPLADRNLADDPRHAETVRRLSALLDKGNGWRKVRERLNV
jgi:hypothetical protein